MLSAECVLRNANSLLKSKGELFARRPTHKAWCFEDIARSKFELSKRHASFELLKLSRYCYGNLRVFPL
jgi:hypothetical protein